MIPIFLNAQPTDPYHVAEVFPSTMFAENSGGIIDFNGKAAFSEKGSLWISDGTMNGSTKITFPEWERIELADVGFSESSSVILNDELYFVVYINRKRNIWATDGTTGGTREVVNIDSAGYYEFRNMKVFGNRIAFAAHVVDEGDRLFLINENGVGAQKVNTISKISTIGLPPRMAVIGNDLYTVESAKLIKVD